MKIQFCFFRFATFFVVMLLGSKANLASASLLVFPTRLALSDRAKAGYLSVRNTSSKEQRYRVSAVYYKMGPDGSMNLVEEGLEDIADSAVGLLRFSPREVTLTGGEEQIVRVMFYSRRPLEDGEYRAHLRFEPVEALEQSSTALDADGGVTMSLKSKVSVAIPVVFSRGRLEKKLELKDLKLVRFNEQHQGFEVKMANLGDGFVFGDFRAEFFENGDVEKKNPVLVGEVRGVSSYIPERTAKYPLYQMDEIKGKTGTLRLSFVNPKDAGGEVLGSVELQRVPAAETGAARSMP